MKRLISLAVLSAVAVMAPASALLPSLDKDPVLADPALAPAQLANIPIALLVDLGSGQVLYSKDADRRFVPASITKVMTLYVAFELLSRGQLVPNQRFTMSEDAWKKWHGVGSTMFLDREHPVSVDELLMGIANVSANDGCVVLAEGAAGNVPNWIALMNAEARRLGMKDSHFGTPNGWMDDGETYVSANDLTKLATAMLTRHPELYRHYIGHETTTWNGITQRNHDPILGKVAGADGIKTGFTNQAGYGFLGSAERNGRRLVMVVAGVDRPKDRADASAALMEWGFAAFDSRSLYRAGQQVGEARVQDGKRATVPLMAPTPLAIASPRGASAGPVSLRVIYDGPLPAPIRKGAVVGSLEIRVGNQAPHRLPLIAGESIVKAGPWDRLVNGLRGLVS